VPALRALGVARLDLLVASHGDLDHRGGLVAVLQALPVGALWLPAGAAREPDFGALRATASRRGVAVREVAAGHPVRRLGDLAVEVLWPPPVARGLTRNDRSLVLRVAVGGRRILLPGDLEAPGEAALLARGADLSADVLKLPHHGSETSSGRAFLEAVSPLLAIASAPCRGRWGMPHPEVRTRVRAAGAALWWTGRDGAVRVALAPRLHALGTGEARRCDSPAAAR
jgi:competence protein ComEC